MEFREFGREARPSGSQGFVHLHRGLAVGESIPRCPALAEQLFAMTGYSREEPVEEAELAAAVVDDEDDL